MEEQIIVNKTEKPNSYEVGKPGSRWKIYFSDAVDLKNQIDALAKSGFNVEMKEEKVDPEKDKKELTKILEKHKDKLANNSY